MARLASPKTALFALTLGLVACDPGSAPEPMEAADGAGGKADAIDGESPEPGSFVELDSREYKVMLDPALFADDPDGAVAAIWDEMADAALALDFEVPDAFDEVRERQVTLLDVAGECPLRNAGFALRHRAEDGAAELTLKLRTVDRYVAAYAALGTVDEDPELKFEEDIVAPFASKYSRSLTVPAAPTVDEVSDPLGRFHGVVEAVATKAALVPVSGTTFHETAYKGARVKIAGKKAKFTLTLWSTEPGAPPAVAELSFGYSVDEEHSFDIARGMLALFEEMKALEGWVSPEAQTKTAFAYGYDAEFCD